MGCRKLNPGRLKLWAPPLPRLWVPRRQTRPARADIGVNSTINSADLTGQGASGTLTVALPPGTNATDVVILTVANFASNPTLTPPAGITLIQNRVSNTNVKMWVYWMPGSQSNLGLTKANFGGDIGWTTVGFTGVDNGTPVDASAVGQTNTGTGTISASSLTVVTANAWQLIATADANDGAWSASGFTAVDNGSTLHQRCGLMYNTTPKGTGPTGTTTCTDGGPTSSQELDVLTLALRPAPSTALPFALLPGRSGFVLAGR